ncbi:discoidin domain-containing protein [Nonomuraea sp. NPDC046570]|uniref:discoidin domain-containing protein n=1 Tax=Nonomuraea sp. NPDC046570 TaxID=3155255 RepID=UPI0033F6CA2B
MSGLGQILAAFTTTVATTAVVVTAPVAAWAAPPLPPDTTYSVTTGASGRNQYVSDSPASLFVDKDGTFYTQQSAALYGPKDPRHWDFFTGTNLDDASRSSAISDAVNPANSLDRNNDTTWRCNNSPTGRIATTPAGSTLQKNYCDLIGTWVDPDTGDWIGLVHNEFTMGPFGDGMHYDSIDYAVSTDQGKTWDIKGHVLTSPYSTNRGDTAAFPNQTYYYGDGDQRLFVDAASGYFYVYYGSTIINKPGGSGNWSMRYEHVARAPMSGKMATGTWQKWFDGAWGEPGVGGKESNIVPVTSSNPNGYTPVADEYDPANTGYIDEQVAAGKMPGQSPLLYMSVTYNAYLGLYLAAANPINPNDSRHAEPLFVTDDLSTQKWHQIGDTGDITYGDYWYHWFADTGSKTSGTIVGRTYREYCDYSCPSGRAEWREITIGTSNPAAPVDPSLSYRITSTSGRTLAQVSGSSATTSVSSPTGSALKAWSFHPTGDGSYTIINSGTGHALGVDSSTTATRAWATQLTATPVNWSVGQQWFIIKNTSPSNSYRLVNRYSGLVLGMSSDSDRLAETTPSRSWTDKTGSPVGDARKASEQTLKLKPVGQAPNLALDKPATAQSSEPGATPERAVDSDTGSYWAAGPLPQWWQVDLQNVYDLSKVTIANHVRGARYYHYDIQASIDGTTWTTVATKNNDTRATKKGDSYAVHAAARYLRVNMTANSTGSSGYITNFTVNGLPAPNLALDKPATAQSSESGATPERAVDSNPETSWAATGPLPQWWQVDLQNVYDLNNVAITNSADGTRYYRYNIQASTDGSTWTTVATKDNDSPATSTGDSYAVNTTARYLRVNMTAGSGGHITNFTVNGLPAPNLALDKPATAQSSEPGATPERAVDSNTGSYWAAGPLPQWWQVDLQNVYDLSNVTITNYADGTRYYRYNIQASTDGTTWTTIATKNNDTRATTTGDSYALTTTARYLRVNMTFNSANPSGHITNFTVNGKQHP